jgi:protein-disulfide isomerase
VTALGFRQTAALPPPHPARTTRAKGVLPGLLLLAFVFTLMSHYATSNDTSPTQTIDRDAILRRVTGLSLPEPPHADRVAGAGSSLQQMPTSLTSEAARNALINRAQVPFFTHNPVEGPDDAPVTVVELSDLSCVSCRATLKQVDAILTDFPEKVRRIHIYNPRNHYDPTPIGVFYSKVAQAEGMFWSYRKAVLDLTDTSEQAYRNAVLGLGIGTRNIDAAIRTDSRRFYRELDADLLSIKERDLDTTPVFFVNGVRIGGGISLAMMKDLIAHEVAVGGPAPASARHGGP